jgi:hypothetical protein
MQRYHSVFQEYRDWLSAVFVYWQYYQFRSPMFGILVPLLLNIWVGLVYSELSL